MVGSRILTALAGLLASLAVSALLYVYTGSLLFFLFAPFVPFLFAGRGSHEAASERPPIMECSRCDFATRNPEFEYCPRDGSRLYERQETTR